MKKKFKHILLFFAIVLLINIFTIDRANARKECHQYNDPITNELKEVCQEIDEPTVLDEEDTTVREESNATGEYKGKCDGLRCFDTNANSGIRITLVDGNGNRISGTATKDYWFSNIGAPSNCLSLYGGETGNTNLMIKQELVYETNYNGFRGSCAYYKNNFFNSFQNAFHVPLTRSSGKPNIDAFVSALEESAVDGDYTYINELLVAVGYPKTVDDMGQQELEELRFQFEPLYYIKFYGRDLWPSREYVYSNATIVSNKDKFLNGLYFVGSYSEIMAMSYIQYNDFAEYLSSKLSLRIKKTENSIIRNGAVQLEFDPRNYGFYPYNPLTGVSGKNIERYNMAISGWGFFYSSLNKTGYKTNGEASSFQLYDSFVTNESGIVPTNVTPVTTEPTVARVFRPGDTKVDGYALGYLWVSAKSTRIGCSSAVMNAYGQYIADGNLTAYINQMTTLTSKFGMYGKTIIWDQNQPDIAPYCVNQIIEECQPGEITFDNCITGVLRLSDSADLSCWYDSDTAYNYGGTTQVSKESEMGSSYCDVYCFETFTTDFPTSVDSVKAGQTFLWGNGSRGDGLFGSVTATRTCRTKTYKYNEWKATWTANENNLRTAYNNYVQAQKMTVSTNKNCNYSVSTQVTVYKCNRYQPVNGGAAAGGYDKLIDSKTFGYSYDGAGNLVQSGNPPSDYIPANGWACTQSSEWVATENRGNDGYTYTATGGVSSDNRSNYGCTLNEQQAKNDGNKYRQDVINRYWGQYTGALTNRTTISNNIKACYTGNVPYNNTTKVTINFSDPLGFRNISTTLNSSGNSSTSQNTNLCTVKQELTYNCAGSGCTVGYTPFVDCSGEGQYAEWNMSASYNYYYTSEFMWNSVKDTNDIVRASGSSGLYYSIGYGLPTSLSLPNGYYGLSATVTGFGHNGHFNNITNTYDYNSCTYKVVNELFGTDCKYDSNGTLTSNSPFYCDPQEDSVVRGTVKGIDLVYRIVSFDNMFPSIDGDGRVPGSNWATVIGTSMYNSITTNDIVYDSEPMYQIELTPALISEIRADNEKYRENGKDPYTSYEASTGSNKEIKCVTNHTIDGTYCVSEFLTELMTENILTGTCTNSGLSSEERANLILANGC